MSGNVLIVNHQHRLDPSEREAEIYTRKELVDALQVTVLSARKLFDSWRTGDWAAIRTAVLCDELASASPLPRRQQTCGSPHQPRPNGAVGGNATPDDSAPPALRHLIDGVSDARGS